MSKTAGVPELKSIKKVAVRFHLYTPRNDNGSRDYAFESKLAGLEQLFGSPFWHIVSTGFPDLAQTATRKGLALLMAVMYLRNPLALCWMHDIHGELVEFFSGLDELPDEIEISGKVHNLYRESWPSYRDADGDAIKRMWLDQVGQAVWLAEILLEMRWSMLVSDEPVLITTDNPVMVMHPSLRFRGFRNPETSVLFPLSSTRALSLDNRHAEPAGQFYDGGKIATCLNSLLWRDSIDLMFSSRHPDLVCAEIVERARQEGFA